MKTHISLGTRNLGASVSFYRALLNSQPAKHFDDYALFLTESPGLELALELDPQARASPGVHFGIAVEEPDLVKNAIERLQRAGLAVDIESEETCCYAVQDKVWATDPDGRRWETYYVIGETEQREGENVTCCRESGDDATSCCCV